MPYAIVERVKARPPAYTVDGLEAARRNEPRPWIGRHAIPRPLLERRSKGVVQGLLGEVEVASRRIKVAKTRRDSER